MNACSESPLFKSMIEKAQSGDATAKKLVHAYQYRPAIELYDIRKDPLEMNNLADDPSREDVIRDLTAKLHAWMEEQGDEGIGTEMKAYERMPKRSAPSKKKS